jgi:hypothetical protein
MSNIVDIFKAGGIKPTELVGEKGFYTKQEEIYENSKLQQKFISSVDYSDPANFAKFGSAEEYYKQAINYIAQYPYDGSSTEKLKWTNSLNDFEYYLYNNEYPRHTGSVHLTASQQIQVYSSGKDETADIKDLYNTGDKYRYSTYLDFAEGITFESWVKLDNTGSTKVLTITAQSSSDDITYTPVDILTITASSNYFSIADRANSYILDYQIDSTQWHHYAFRVTTGSVELFVDGQRKVNRTDVEISKTISSHVFTPFGLFILKLNRVYPSPTNYDNTPSFKLGGNNFLSLDDTRFWNGMRSIEKIGRFWFTHVDGNDRVSNFLPEPTEPSLIFYYKYNEGYNEDRAEYIVDSSGRKNDGITTNPGSYTFRSTESAFSACGFVQDTEQADVIVGSTSYSSRLLSFYNERIAAGLEYDQNNIHSLYRKFPSWVLETEEDNEVKQLKQLIQVVSVYFDDLYNKIGEISQYKHQKLTEDTEKIYPFYDKILTSTGFDVTELFSNLSGVEGVSSRDDLNLFDENTQKVKNQIYQNIYNNLAYILKSKGSEKSLKSLLRTYGVDENLVRINLYGDRSEYNVADKYKEKVIKKKTLSLLGAQYVSSSAFGTLNEASAELQAFIPSSVREKISLLTLGPSTAFLTASNGNIKLQLSSSQSSSLSSEFTIPDMEMPWNISLRYQDGLYTLDALNFVASGSYNHLTASISGTSPSSIIVGSSGSYSTEQTAVDVALWNTYLDVDTLKVHARDITNYGIPDVKSLNDKIVLYWDFEKVTSTEVPDLFNTNTGQTSADLTGGVEKQSIKTYKTLNYDILDANDTIQILDEDDVYNRSLLKKPSSTRLLIENSMYQVISDEMINMFSSINDYVFSFAEAGNLYEHSYKNLDVLRRNFFSKITNTPDIEKYVEFYKWLDSSLGYMLDQIKPENSNSSKGLKNTIESHMLERNKYQYKLPLTVAPNNVFNPSVTVVRSVGSDIKPILADSDNKKYRGMVQNEYIGPVENIENKQGVNYSNNYEILHTAGKQHNNRGDKKNKTVFRNNFSSGDGLSELNRDDVTGGEYSIYNSLLNKSSDARDILNISSSHLLGEYYNLGPQKHFITEVSYSYPSSTSIVQDYYPPSSGSAGARISWTYTAYPTFDYVLTTEFTCSTGTLDPYTSSLLQSYNINTDGAKISGSYYLVNYTSGSQTFTTTLVTLLRDPGGNRYILGITPTTGSCSKPTPSSLDKICLYSSNFILNTSHSVTTTLTQSNLVVSSELIDNLFVQRNIPYTASNYAHTNSVDYQAIPNELILGQHRANAITASGIGYREPPVEWNVPMYHDLKVVGAFENMEVLSPYSSRVNDFANDGLNTALIGVSSKSDSGSFYRKIDGLDSGSVQVNRIEHLENVFPPRKLMGLQKIRSKPGYDEVSGSFNTVTSTWSDDSYNRNTALINSFWRTNESDRRRTRGIDNPMSYTGSFNCLGEFNKYETSSGILTDRTGSVTGSQYKAGDYYIKLQVKYTTNRYDSIYSMDSIVSKTYDD